MTFFAKRTEHGNHVDVHVTYGPVEVKVTEDPGHLRHFWHELGKVLNETEQAAKAAHAEHEAAG